MLSSVSMESQTQHLMVSRIHTPASKKDEKPKCTGEGEVFVEFTTTKDDKKAGICTTTPQDNKCPSYDKPKGYQGAPSPIPDADGKASHCEFTCSTNADCATPSKDQLLLCISVKPSSKKSFAMLSDEGSDVKMCLYKNAFLLS